VFALGAYEVAAGRLTTGELIAAAAMGSLIFTPITRLSELTSAYQQAAACLQRLGEIFDASFENHARRTNVPACLDAGDDDCSKGRIEFDNVEFRYVADRPVLRGVSLTIEPRSRVAVVGPTGSGKTTLLNLLLRFYEPTGGTIRLKGRPISDLTHADLREQIGIVPQEAVVFRGTLAENIGYGIEHASRAAIEAAGTAACLDELVHRLPQAYDTLVGEGGHPLSQGQRQRIAIARLICKNPAIVVLDEATSNLDRTGEIEVQQALGMLLAGRTTLVIAHRLATIQDADQIIVMNHGRIVQRGTHRELLADESGCYRRLYESQFPLPSIDLPQPAALEPRRAPVALAPQPAAA
jgi:ABC-type multidrug transport system fused ATPase/permease subunit